MSANDFKFGNHNGRVVANAFTNNEINNIYARITSNLNGLSPGTQEYLVRKRNEAKTRINNKLRNGTAPNIGHSKGGNYRYNGVNRFSNNGSFPTPYASRRRY